MSRSMTKPLKPHGRPAKTQINIRIRTVQSVLARRLVKDNVHSDRENLSDFADTQAELSLQWGHVIL